MSAKTKKQKIIITFSWILVLICMGLIFYFSSQVAEDSAEMSEGVLQWIMKTFNISANSFIVRKLAHFLEYGGLSILVFNALVQTTGKPKLFLNFLIPSIYAVTDEIHQYFVEGRACSVFDIGVDMIGSIIGIICCLVFYHLHQLLKNKKNR